MRGKRLQVRIPSTARVCVGLLPGLKYFFWTREALVLGGVSTPVLKEDFSTG